MKRFIVAGAAAVAFYSAGPANAASPVFNWSGFYIGGNGGYAQGTDTVTHKFDFFGFLSDRTAYTNPKGGLGGLQYGFLGQSGPVVFGIESTWDFGRLKGDVTSPAFPASDVWHSKIDMLTTTTARFGYSMGAWLPYVKAGWAWGRVAASADCLTCTPPEIWKNTQWQNGGTVGAGIDFMLAGNWILGVEYNYVALASKHHGGVTSGSGFHVSDDEKSTLNMVTGRISYKFGSQ